jgi:hypothetical protein
MSLMAPELGEAVADEATVMVVLLRKFVAGIRLASEELDILSRIMPTCGKARWRRCYSRTAEEYARLYDASPRTVKWWKAQGDKHPKGQDIPPLDSPSLMPAWWARVMKQRCPDNILSAARAAGWNAAPSIVPLPSLQGAGLPALPEKPPAITPPAPTGPAPQQVTPLTSFEDNLSNLLTQESIAHQDLLTAQAESPVDPAKVEQCRRRWLTLQEAARKAQSQAPEYFERIGRYIDKQILAAELTRMIAAAGLHIRAARRRLQAELDAAPDEVAKEAIWQRGIDEAFAELQRAGYAEPFALMSAA